MPFDTSAFLSQIENVTTSARKLDADIEILSRNIAVLRQRASADYAEAHGAMEAAESAMRRMADARAALLESVRTLSSASAAPETEPEANPCDTLCECAVTLAIIRNAMDMLANDSEGRKNLLPWQRMLFGTSYAHLAGIVRKLNAAHQALQAGTAAKKSG